MTEQNIQFELVSPERKLVDAPMHHVVIPGTEGYLGVGRGHASFVVSLGNGTVTLYEKSMDEAAPKTIFIAGGFADISADRCTVLAEQAINLEDLDAKTLQTDLKDLQAQAKKAEGAEKSQIETKIEIVEAQMKAIS